MAAVVSEYLRRLLAEQVEEHGLVVWFDPDGVYADLAESLELPGVAIERFDGSYLDLRRRVEPHLSPYRNDGEQTWRERPGNVLVYVPIDRDEACRPLVDLCSLGTAIYPSAPGKHNTKLSLITRNALRDVLPPANIDSLVADVDQGQLSLAEIDKLAEQGAGLESGRLMLIFNTSNADDIALTFLSSDENDAALVGHAATPELAALFASTFDLPDVNDESPPDLRHRLSRYLMLTEVIHLLGKSTPSSLGSVSVPAKGEARNAVLKLISAWRDGRAYGESYADAANRVAQELGSQVFTDVPFEALRRLQTFRNADAALRSSICLALRNSSSVPADMISEAEARVSGFWSAVDVTHRELWQIVLDAGRLLDLASEIERALRPGRLAALALFDHYTSGDRPWCLIDQWQRHLYERHGRYHADIAAAQDAREIEALVIHARTRHARVIAELAEAFSTAFAKSRFSLSDALLQADTFASRVKPALEQHRVAYVLVDALRYEMAQELAAAPVTGWDTTLQPAVATFPTITKVGMAALMPGAERGITLTGPGQGSSQKLSVEIAGAQVNSRAERLKLLQGAMPDGWVECKLDDLTPARPAFRKQLENAPAVFVTSGGIDQAGENVDPAVARPMMIQVLAFIRQACATLAFCGFDRVIISADHGYLFGEDFSEGEKIDQPGGSVVELHRRVWIGHGGSQTPAVLRMAASDLGLSGDLEFATPRSTAVFIAQGGSLDYVHGGLSLQELVVPVVELSRATARQAAPGGALTWSIELGSKTISTRVFTATLRATSSELLPITAPRVRVDLLLDGQRVAGSAAAAYGHNNETGEIELRVEGDKTNVIEPNTVTFLLDGDDLSGAGSIVVTDASTGVELYRYDDIPVSIAF